MSYLQTIFIDDVAYVDERDPSLTEETRSKARFVYCRVLNEQIDMFSAGDIDREVEPGFCGDIRTITLQNEYLDLMEQGEANVSFEDWSKQKKQSLDASIAYDGDGFRVFAFRDSQPIGALLVVDIELESRIGNDVTYSAFVAPLLDSPEDIYKCYATLLVNAMVAVNDEGEELSITLRELRFPDVDVRNRMFLTDPSVVEWLLMFADSSIEYVIDTGDDENTGEKFLKSLRIAD